MNSVRAEEQNLWPVPGVEGQPKSPEEPKTSEKTNIIHPVTLFQFRLILKASDSD